MQLFSPLCLVPDGASSAGPSGDSTSTAAGAAAGADAAQAALPPLPDADCMAALGWLAPSVGTAALEVAASAAGSCCALPPVRVRLREADLAEAGVAGAGAAAARASLCAPSAQQHHPQQLQQAQPADSQATLASAGAPAGLLSHVVVSPEARCLAAPAARRKPPVRLPATPALPRAPLLSKEPHHDGPPAPRPRYGAPDRGRSEEGRVKDAILTRNAGIKILRRAPEAQILQIFRSQGPGNQVCWSIPRE